jgi:hypothetical protein
MPGLAKSSRSDSRRATRHAPAWRHAPAGATRLASTYLMPAGSGLTIPRLYGVPVEQQLWQGEQPAARLAHSFLEAGVADADDWIVSKQNPFEFLKRTLERWLIKQGEPVIREQFFLDLLLSTTLDRYSASNGKPGDVSRVFLTLEPDSAGYVILGPTLRLLESVHPRLPATFLHLFLGALNQWLRVYDYRDAFDRVERLRDWYECDPEGGEVELPDIDRCLPKSAKRRPLSRRTLATMAPGIKIPLARQLMELAIELDRMSCQRERPKIDDEISELLIDCGEPVPALLAVFERSDPIEGCFDEDSQTMLELTPAPNLIVRFNGETKEGVVGAFTVLSTVCETLSCASRLMTIMPGNERLIDEGARE